MVAKEEAIKRVKELVDKYKRLLDSDKAKEFNEERTKNELIEPLFEALGWDIRNKYNEDEVTKEERVSRNRVDYAFRLNGIPKFFVEAKKLSENIDDMNHARQAINYAYHKGVTWAVLTNFVGIRIFNAEWKIQDTFHAKFVSLDFDNFIEKFEKLWWISKESFENGLIDKEAESVGKKAKKVSIDKQLLSDFMAWREMLSKNIMKNNQSKNLSDEELDEIVQRILDRLIFIRNCEDRGLEPKKLQEKLREWEDNENKKLIIYLRDIFSYFDKDYDSKLFQFHDCDKVEIDNYILNEIINGLYNTSQNLVSYDFSAIDADILGNMYEQYLGNILKKTEKRAKIERKHVHRKEQGIYYTPTYIVDYIVRNTVDELLKEKNIDPEKIRILDPACGSGSFLIKAFDVLNEHYKKKTGVDSFMRSSKILTENIFGVDLDPKAVEITQLNLLLKTAEKRHKLPMLQQNIKCGNSVIDDPNVAGERAFKWEEQFEDIMKAGKFDVVIGNPPYVDIKQLNPKIVRYFFENYCAVENRMNIYSVFVEKALNLLKEGGYFGFIVPNSILYNESYQKIRKLLLDNVKLRKIVRLPDNVFQDVKVETIILIYQKKKEMTKKLNCEVLIYPRESTINSINKENNVKVLNFNQKIWETKNNVINITTNTELIKLLKKIGDESINLQNLCDFSLGLTPYDKYKGHSKEQIEERVFHSKIKKNSIFKPLLSGENITRYNIFWDGKEYISYGKWLGAPREQRFFMKPRIIVRQIISGKPPRIYAGYTEEEYYNTQIAFNIIVKDEGKISPKYLLSILNSKLMTFYHKEKCLDPSKNLFQKILIANAKNFPIKVIPLEKQKSLIILVDKMLSLNKRLSEFGDKRTDAKAKLEEEINKTDAEIDKHIFEIYELSEEEKKIIEESLKKHEKAKY